MFTKYDQFKRNVKMALEDDRDSKNVESAVDEQFKKHYHCHLDNGAKFVLLESVFRAQILLSTC